MRELEQGTQALRQQVLQAQAQHKQALDQLVALGESSHQVQRGATPLDDMMADWSQNMPSRDLNRLVNSE